MGTRSDEASRNEQYWQVFDHRIATLAGALKTGTSADWETSEPYCVGGPGSAAGTVYSARSPFTGDCQFKVDFASAGASGGQVIVSTGRKTSGVDYTGVQSGFSEVSPYEGLVINLPANGTVPVDSEWYNVRDSQNTVFVLVILPGPASAFANIQFRQKRGK